MAEQMYGLRAAQARRRYWMEELDAARSAGDRLREADAARFVAEYDQLIAVIEEQLRG